MESQSPRLRALARWFVLCSLALALVPSALCLARKVSAFGRADVLVSPEPEGLRVRRVGESAAPSGLRAGDLLLLVDGEEARQSGAPSDRGPTCWSRPSRRAFACAASANPPPLRVSGPGTCCCSSTAKRRGSPAILRAGSPSAPPS